MIDIVSKFVKEFFDVAARESSRMIRSEIEYVTGSIKRSIHDGIREGFEAIRANIFYLFLAMGCTLTGLIFIIWGFAKLFAWYFKIEGLGFLIFGLLALLVGIFSFAMSKPR